MTSNKKHNVLGPLSPAVFLQEYWQRKPLLVRQALPGFQNPISADELAGLSLEAEVESRLVIEHGRRPWELQHGPFTEKTYQKLPEQNWTLLVQAVDQWAPQVAQLLSYFRFLPSWRIDDVMVSYAPTGGSVGPHFDYYDVFLLQGQGRRRWRIGQQCDTRSPCISGTDLRILKDFQQTDEWVLEPGDMLYLPPGIAHYGIALDECMTYSVGFRAPSAAEALTHFTDYLAQSLSEDERYSDAGLAITKDPERIYPQALERLRALLSARLDDQQQLLGWFGRFMTEPRYPECLEGVALAAPELAAQLQRGAVLLHSSAARFAWAEDQGSSLLFAAGEAYRLPTQLTDLIKRICSKQVLDADALTVFLADPKALALLCNLLEQGVLELHNP